jgi:hypothetical protein
MSVTVYHSLLTPNASRPSFKFKGDAKKRESLRVVGFGYVHAVWYTINSISTQFSSMEF